jgi:prepilin-type N-terminal cleavage/methylation domain-containing protein
MSPTVERKAREHGFTIVELIVSLALLSVLLVGVFNSILTTQRMYTVESATARAQESLRAAEYTISTILRTAGADPYGTGTTFVDPDPLARGAFDNLRVVSDFNPPDGDTDDILEDVLVWVGSDTLWIRWSAGGEDQPMSYPVTSIEFRYFANDGTELASAADVASGATQALFTLVAPRNPTSQAVERRESWVYLRNR